MLPVPPEAVVIELMVLAFVPKQKDWSAPIFPAENTPFTVATTAVLPVDKQPVAEFLASAK